MASQFASVTIEEIIKMNYEAVHENKKKATKFGLTQSLSIKTNEKGFVYKCKLILSNLTCSLENQDGGVRTLLIRPKNIGSSDFFIQFIKSIQRYAYTRFRMKKFFLFGIEFLV